MIDCVCLLQGFISGARLIAYHHSWESWPSELRITWDQQETAAAAAESLQSCLTPWDSHRPQPTRLPRPRDSSGKNTGVGCHFLLQCVKVKVKLLSRVWLLATPWTAAYQVPPSMGFSRQEYWSGVPLSSPQQETTVQQWKHDSLCIWRSIPSRWAIFNRIPHLSQPRFWHLYVRAVRPI